MAAAADYNDSAMKLKPFAMERMQSQWIVTGGAARGLTMGGAAIRPWRPAGG